MKKMQNENTISSWKKAVLIFLAVIVTIRIGYLFLDDDVEKEYYIAVKNLGITVQEKDCRLMLMGITPAEPSDQFGYIEPETDETVSLVRSFFEKPDPEKAFFPPPRVP